MIRPPHRSVTRFFIPLIDVLILLFCIFLLMPYVTPTEGESPENAGRIAANLPNIEPTGDEMARVRGDLEQTTIERDRLKERLDSVLKRLAVRVLEIDKDTGRLYYYDSDKVEIATDADAQQLIDRDRRRAAGRETYFLILYPRSPSGYPLRSQVARYERWFRDVPHGFDSPSGRP